MDLKTWLAGQGRRSEVKKAEHGLQGSVFHTAVLIQDGVRLAAGGGVTPEAALEDVWGLLPEIWKTPRERAKLA